jgi:hypothetical protein
MPELEKRIWNIGDPERIIIFDDEEAEREVPQHRDTFAAIMREHQKHVMRWARWSGFAIGLSGALVVLAVSMALFVRGVAP